MKNQNHEVAVIEHPELKSLDLADFCYENRDLQPQILVGVDFYYSFVTGKINP